MLSNEQTEERMLWLFSVTVLCVCFSHEPKPLLLCYALCFEMAFRPQCDELPHF